MAPSALSLGAGETGTYEISFTNSSADLYEWQFGSLSWADATHTVRSPLAVRPVPFIAPPAAIASGTSGNLQFDVQFGYTGTYEAIVQGLAPPFIEIDLPCGTRLRCGSETCSELVTDIISALKSKR